LTPYTLLKKSLGWRYDSLVEYLPSMCEERVQSPALLKNKKSLLIGVQSLSTNIFESSEPEPAYL
jgi:hypothetical protein